MAVAITRGPTDPAVERIAGALEAYQADYPAARIDMYRLGTFSIHARIIDDHFRGMTRGARASLVWRYFDALPEDDVADITMLILLTPDELPRSGSNLEFEDPVPLGSL